MENPIDHISDTLRVISFCQMRTKTLENELQFSFHKLPNKEMHIGAFIRLKHEVMHLCIDVYSLHQGISKKKSLYRSIIMQNAKQLGKVDKTGFDLENIIDGGVFEADGSSRKSTQKELEEFKKIIDAEGLENRKKARDLAGIKSSKHKDLNSWLQENQDIEAIEKLEKYRKKFAHRLDSLENLKTELSSISYEDLKSCLNTVSSVLDSYHEILKNIIFYTTSSDYRGLAGIKYDCISRLKQCIELQPIIEKGMNTIS